MDLDNVLPMSLGSSATYVPKRFSSRDRMAASPATTRTLQAALDIAPMAQQGAPAAPRLCWRLSTSWSRCPLSPRRCEVRRRRWIVARE